MKIDSTIKELELFKYQVQSDEAVTRVENYFKKNKNVPGVILLRGRDFIGVVSQQKFWEYMSLPYSREISSRKSIYYIYNYLQVKSLIISLNTTILNATKIAIKRSRKELEEPIVVKVAPNQYRLISLQKILLAQSKIHEIANVRLKKLHKNINIANQKLTLSLSLDGLSKLYNQRVFTEYLQREWKKAQNKSRKNLSLIIVGLDDFKSYNEIYGCLTGDDVIKQIAGIIRKALQNLDGAAGRYGGDRFAIILCNQDAIDAACIAKKIRQELKVLKIGHSGSRANRYLTVSFGIASLIPALENNKNSEILLSQAEEALMDAKKGGKNCTKIWTNINIPMLFSEKMAATLYINSSENN